MAQSMCKHQVLVNFHSQFCIEIECTVKTFTELVSKLNSQCHTFSKWATSIWANVRKLEEHESGAGCIKLLITFLITIL